MVAIWHRATSAWKSCDTGWWQEMLKATARRLSVSSGLTVASSRRRGGVRGMAGAGTDGCTNLQLGHAGEDLQSMTRRWQLTHGTATIGPNEPTPPPPLAILASSSAMAAAPPELALPAPTWKVDGIVEMLSSRSRVLLPPCSSMGLTQLFLMVFLFRSRHCSQSMGRGSLRWRSRLAWDTASSQAKCFLLFLLPSSLLPSDSDDDELLPAPAPAPTPKPSNVGPRESSGCTSIDRPILCAYTASPREKRLNSSETYSVRLEFIECNPPIHLHYLFAPFGSSSSPPASLWACLVGDLSTTLEEFARLRGIQQTHGVLPDQAA
uniref:Uncharacterized protein n=1 Tax=Oryza glumipatula TaxID=40148 RepID=A0A0E0BHX5_9ORYZ